MLWFKCISRTVWYWESRVASIDNQWLEETCTQYTDNKGWTTVCFFGPPSDTATSTNQSITRSNRVITGSNFTAVSVYTCSPPAPRHHGQGTLLHRRWFSSSFCYEHFEWSSCGSHKCTDDVPTKTWHTNVKFIQEHQAYPFFNGDLFQKWLNYTRCCLWPQTTALLYFFLSWESYISRNVQMWYINIVL